MIGGSILLVGGLSISDLQLFTELSERMAQAEASALGTVQLALEQCKEEMLSMALVGEEVLVVLRLAVLKSWDRQGNTRKVRGCISLVPFPAPGWPVVWGR